MCSLACFLLGLLLGQRRATVICTRHDFQAKLFGESDFGGVVAEDGNALEDVPERSLKLAIALCGNCIPVANSARTLMLGHRGIVDRAQQRSLLCRGSVHKILSKEV